MSNFDFRKPIDETVLDGLITTTQDDEGSNCYTVTLQTQPDFINADGEEIENPYDGFTAVKKQRLNLPHFMSLPENHFSPWFDDPVEESE